MHISFSKHEGRVPVIVMHLTGDLDASNYTDVIVRAQEAYDEGARNIVIDLSKVPYVSSAGLMSLHTLALIFTGNAIQASGLGRPSFRSLDQNRDQKVKEHVRLLSPQPPVAQVLDTIGLRNFLSVYTDLESAIQAF
ncbi:MAG: STAS domain-containing protein [Anaerolineales bacterium]